MTEKLSYPRYVLRHGSYYLMGEPSTLNQKLVDTTNILTMTDQVSMVFHLCANVDGTLRCILLKHGKPEMVSDYFNKCAAVFEDDVRSITFPSGFDPEEFNKCIHHTGYLTTLIARVMPELLEWTPYKEENPKPHPLMGVKRLGPDGKVVELKYAVSSPPETVDDYGKECVRCSNPVFDEEDSFCDVCTNKNSEDLRDWLAK